MRQFTYEKQRLRSLRGFDLGQAATYYTRPMPVPWSKLHDVDLLADQRAELAFDIPLRELPRLREQLASHEGSARGSVRFGREAGVPTADLELDCTVALVCQRCLGPLPWPVESHVQVGLLASEADEERVPEGLETMFLEGGRVSVREIVEEEMLLSLPVVPLHERPEDCPAEGEVPPPATAEPDESTVQRPFERLGELLKRDE